MMMAGLHWADPLWLLLLPAPLLVAFWLFFSSGLGRGMNLSAYADAHLLPLLLGSYQKEGKKKGSKRRLIWWSLIWALLVIALAGPRLGFKEVQLFRPGSDLVVVLDISGSMDVADVAPSRMARARQEIDDLISANQADRGGSGVRIGLIAFASLPHVVAPLTEDAAALRSHLPALSGELVKLKGSRLTAALVRAGQMLQGQPAESQKHILLISDGDFGRGELADQGASETAAGMRKEGIHLHTLGIGTPEGGAVKDSLGRPLRFRDGRIILSKLDEATLQGLAHAGGGQYIRADFQSHDSVAILKRVTQKAKATAVGDKVTRIWNERFYWPLGLGMLLLLPWFRKMERSTTLQMGLLLLLLTAPQAGEAALLENREAKGEALYKAGDYSEAAKAFRDPYRRGVALYRAGQYAEAEAAFARSNRDERADDALYNRANSQLMQEKFTEAVESFNTLLNRNPDHADGHFNRSIARTLLADAQAKQKQEEEAEKAEQEKQKKKEKKKEGDKKKEDKESKSGDKKKEDKESKSGDKKKEDKESKSGDEESEKEESSGDKESEEEKSGGEQESEKEESGGEQESDEQKKSGGEQESEKEESGGEQESDEQKKSGGEQEEKDQKEGDQDSDQQDASGDQEGKDQERGDQDREDAEDSDKPSEQKKEQESDEGEEQKEDAEPGSQEEKNPDEKRAGDESRENDKDRDAQETKPGEERDSERSTEEGDQQAGRPNAAEQPPKESLEQQEPTEIEAVKQFDLRGGAADWQQPEQEDGAPKPEHGAQGQQSGYTTLVEQWLEGVEGDPALLLKKRFAQEERRLLQQSPTGLRYEPRPW
uniref:VWFA domain-containing protein n=1 Tax=Magnetococcus massalia (strain MO-1) TaxID=451514 RepID=A0A1S7LF26_MAGMO|nr:protein of unknown function. Containing TPR domain [Candidatus Magnetococcus massalia]